MANKIIQTEHISRENGVHYFEQEFNTITTKRLELKDYIEIQAIIDELVRDRTNGK